LTVAFHHGPPLGPGVVQASMDEVLGALQAHGDLDWSEAADLVVPVMPRVRPFPPGTPPPLQALVDPGIVVSFGVDVGPAFMAVTPELAAHWKVTTADVLSRALANLHARAELVDVSMIHRASLDSIPTEWLQTGQSIGSTLILAPAELRRIFGPEPRLFITPMRDVIIGLPIDCSRDLATWLHRDIAANDPNCLGPTAYRFDGRRVIPESVAGDRAETDHASAPLPFLVA
jgi:hypothetical protein